LTNRPLSKGASLHGKLRYSAEQSLLATRLVREANTVELYRALGGGLR
jgi:hypothetical protein